MNAWMLSLSLLLAPVLQGDWPTGTAPPEKKVTLQVKDATPREVLKLIAAQSGWSVVLPEDVKELDQGRVSLDIKDANPADVLELVCRAQHVSAVRKGNVVMIAAEADADGAGWPDDKRRKDKEDDAEARAEDGEHDRVRVGSGVHVRGDEVVGDAVSIGGSVEVLGKATDAVAIGGNVHIGPQAEVRGDAVSIGGRLTVDKGARVKGDQVEVGAGMLRQHILASVIGVKGAEAAIDGHSAAFSAAQAVAMFVIFFIFGLIALTLAPERLAVVADAVTQRPLRAGLFGLLGAVATTLLTGLLIVTLIGIPLAFLVVAAAVAIVFFGFTALALRIGELLPLGGRKSPVWALALGTLLLVIVAMVPFGKFLLWLTSFFVFGAALAARMGSAPQSPGPVYPPASSYPPIPGRSESGG